jgi:protein TonB
MTGSASPAPGPSRPQLPEWVVPWGVSLLLHLLVVGLAVHWLAVPREIIWVDLLETRIVRREAPQRTAVPTATSRPMPVRAAAPPTAAPVRRVTPVAADTTRPAPSPEPISPVAKEASGPAMPVATATGQVQQATPVPAALPGAEKVTAGTGRPEPAVETPEQRYLREQYAYIREQVTARLVYPPLARRQGWSGQVRVEFTVCADGSVEGLKVAASSGRSLFDRQALRAVQAAAPFPAPPAPALIRLPVSFTLGAVAP